MNSKKTKVDIDELKSVSLIEELINSKKIDEYISNLELIKDNQAWNCRNILKSIKTGLEKIPNSIQQYGCLNEALNTEEPEENFVYRIPMGKPNYSGEDTVGKVYYYDYEKIKRLGVERNISSKEKVSWILNINKESSEVEHILHSKYALGKDTEIHRMTLGKFNPEQFLLTYQTKGIDYAIVYNLKEMHEIGKYVKKETDSRYKKIIDDGGLLRKLTNSLIDRYIIHYPDGMVKKVR